MFRTITIAGTISAQGIQVREHADGRVTISTGSGQLTGWPVRRVNKCARVALVLG